MVRGLSSQLRLACSTVVSSAQGLPGAVQDQLSSARQSAEELHSSLGNASSLTPLLLERSRRHLTQVRTGQRCLCAISFIIIFSLVLQ